MEMSVRSSSLASSRGAQERRPVRGGGGTPEGRSRAQSLVVEDTRSDLLKSILA